MNDTIDTEEYASTDDIYRFLCDESFINDTPFEKKFYSDAEHRLIYSLSKITYKNVYRNLMWAFDDIEPIVLSNLNKTWLNGRPVVFLLYYLSRECPLELSYHYDTLTQDMRPFPDALADITSLLSEIGFSFNPKS